VIEYSAAFIQLYREDAHYLERTAPWVERIGLTSIKEQIVDNEVGRQKLAERFHFSQKYSQDDPWTQRAKGAEAHEFVPMKQVG